MVLQETSLVRLEQEALDALTGEEVQPPGGMLDEPDPRGLVLFEEEHDVGESWHRDVGWGDPLADRPLEHAEIPQPREEPLGYPAGCILGPGAPGLALRDPLRQKTLDLAHGNLSGPPRLQGGQPFDHDVAE